VGEFSSFRVSRLRNRRDVPGLVEALRSSNHKARRAAANALIEIPDPRTIEPLIAALGDPDELVRVNAALALGELQGLPELPAIVEPLTRALRDPSPHVRAMAASALGRGKDPAAVPVLIEALDDQDGAVRAAARALLPTFGDPRADDALRSRAAAD
jgi:HEAT repeat protein